MSCSPAPASTPGGLGGELDAPQVVGARLGGSDRAVYVADTGNLPAIVCARAAGGRSLTCSAPTLKRVRKLRITLSGPGGVTATGTAKGKQGRHAVVLTASAALPAGRYLYRHVATTTRKGEKIFVVRVVTVT